MTITLIPYPFKPIRSFLAYAVGEEKVVLKPEWAGVFAPAAAVARKEAA